MTLLLALFACNDATPDQLGASTEPKAAFGGILRRLHFRESVEGSYDFSVQASVCGLEDGEAEQIRGLELVVDDDAVLDLEPGWTERKASTTVTFDKDPSTYTYAFWIKLKGTSGRQSASASVSTKVTVDGEPVVVEWSEGEVVLRATSIDSEKGGAAVFELTMTDHVGEDGTTSAHFDWSGSSQGLSAADGGPSSTSATDLVFADEVELLLEGSARFDGNPAGSSYEVDAEVYDQDGKKLAKHHIDVDFWDDTDSGGVPLATAGFGKGTRNSCSNAGAKPELL